MEDTGTNNLEHLASKLSTELEQLRKIDGDNNHIKNAIVIKDQLLREIRDFLSKKNNEAK